LTFCIHFSNSEQSPENCHLYTWVESERGRGPNEVCSILLHFLEKLQERIKKETIPELNLFSDSCSTQNKHQFVVATLLYYINYNNTIFNKINHIFPVRGHSYMPPDQVFGRIEKCLRKKENMVSPTEYYTVFEKCTKVHIFNKDFFMYDFNKVAFPPTLWATEPSTEARMTNGPEYFHSHYNAQFYTSHPSIHQVIHIFLDQSETYLKIYSIKQQNINKPRKEQEENIAFINNTWEKYKNN